MRSTTWRVAGLLFVSGLCALVYQVAWLREFRLIFGASTAASAAVLAIFIGGLGAGGLLLGSRADRHPRPLLFYAELETIVAISAAATPFLLDLARAIYLASGGSSALGASLATGARLFLTFLVLAVPVLAMGGTLPAAARSATRAVDVSRRDVSVIYALNTLGAVAGCVLATFVLLEMLGTRQTIWIAAAVNLLIAMVARQVGRSRSTVPAALHAVRAAAEAGTGDAAADSGSDPAVHEPADGRAAPVAFLIAASAAVGFAFFLMELVWYRLLAPLLGGSVFTFGLVLAIEFVGIGVGGLIYNLFAANRPATLAGFATSCLLEAAAVAVTYALGDRVALLSLTLLPLRMAGFATQIGGWALVSALVVLPPAIVAGYQFPLLIALFGRGRDQVGRQIGIAYGANTAGAIAGSLAGGFGLLPWLSATGAGRLVAVLLLLLGAWAAALTGFRMRRRILSVRVLLAAATLICLAAEGPSGFWRHGGIGAGRVPQDVLSSPNALRAWRQVWHRNVLWERDGVESGVALVYGSDGYAFVVNGKADGNARVDAGTQVMLGLLGSIRHPEPRRALVIGLGTGSTAGWLAAVPSMQRVDVVELEPVVLDVAAACLPVNHDVLADPKVHVTIGDARETLLTSRDQYDVIASEPSNPYRAGIASLFTQEFYRAANQRLSERGVFAQWVQAYEIESRTLRTIYATMASVFPNVETWQTASGDLVLIATKTPRSDEGAALAARIAEEPYRTALANVWRVTNLDGFLSHHLASDVLTRAVAGARGVEINTDDRNVVEFGLARSVGRSSVAIPGVRALARSLGADRGPVDAAAVFWPAVDTAWTSFNASVGGFGDPLPETAPEERARQLALGLYFDRQDMARARESWTSQSAPPRDITQLGMAADLEADAGSESAIPLIELHRKFQPAEADLFLATLRWRQGRIEEAASALQLALVRLRTDPWPLLRYKQRALALADAIARQNPALSRRMFEALRQPFAVGELHDQRLLLSADLTRRLDFANVCRNAVDAFGEHVPWSGSFLALRRDCYQAIKDPRLDAAQRDLDDYLSAEALPLGAGIANP